MHRLESHVPAIDRVRVRGAVANGIDIRVARLAVIIDNNAVVDIEACRTRELRIRCDADSDNHQVRRNLVALRCRHRFHAPFAID